MLWSSELFTLPHLEQDGPPHDGLKQPAFTHHLRQHIRPGVTCRPLEQSCTPIICCPHITSSRLQTITSAHALHKRINALHRVQSHRVLIEHPCPRREERRSIGAKHLSRQSTGPSSARRGGLEPQCVLLHNSSYLARKVWDLSQRALPASAASGIERYAEEIEHVLLHSGGATDSLVPELEGVDAQQGNERAVEA